MLRECWLIFQREMTISLRNPAWIMIGIVQPVLYLFLFGPFLEPVIKNTPGFPPGGAWVVFTPGSRCSPVHSRAFSLLADYKAGVLERLRVTPASRLALLLGKVATNATQTVVQVILIVVSSPVCCSIYTRHWRDRTQSCDRRDACGHSRIGLVRASLAYQERGCIPCHSEFDFGSGTLAFGIIIPITTGLAPDWLYAISRFNPFTHVVDVERASFRGDTLFTGYAVLVVLAAITMAWGARTFQKENA